MGESAFYAMLFIPFFLLAILVFVVIKLYKSGKITFIHESPETPSFEEEVISEVTALHNKKKGRLRNLLIFSVSLLLFSILSSIYFSWLGIVILAVVLFVHESGHFIGMRKFKYRDPQMFFIPFLGAAVAGTETNPKGVQKAIISLLGPLPGILLGVIFGLLYLIFRIHALLVLSVIFLVLNGLNLLPFYPMDGGRFLDAVLFSRNLRVEIAFKLLTSLTLFGIAVYLHSWVLGIFAFLNVISVNMTYKIGSIAAEFREPLILNQQYNDNNIPIDILKRIISRLREKLPALIQKPKKLARFADIIWKKIYYKPPSINATLALLSVYTISLFTAILFPIITTITLSPFESKIETFQKDDGSVGRRESIFFGETLMSQTEISTDDLYHGNSDHYILHRVLEKGQWNRGKMDGEWSYFDFKGNLVRTITFDKGHFVTEKRLKNGSWIERKWDDLTAKEKKLYKQHEMGAPLGPKVDGMKPHLNF